MTITAPRRRKPRKEVPPAKPAPGLPETSRDEEGPEPAPVESGVDVPAQPWDVERERAEPADAEWIDAEVGPAHRPP